MTRVQCWCLPQNHSITSVHLSIKLSLSRSLEKLKSSFFRIGCKFEWNWACLSRRRFPPILKQSVSLKCFWRSKSSFFSFEIGWPALKKKRNLRFKFPALAKKGTRAEEFRGKTRRNQISPKWNSGKWRVASKCKEVPAHALLLLFFNLHLVTWICLFETKVSFAPKKVSFS